MLRPGVLIKAHPIRPASLSWERDSGEHPVLLSRLSCNVKCRDAYAAPYVATLEDVATSISADALASFGQAVLAFAGLWPLTRTTLDGPFQLTQTALLIPTTLESLHARVDCKQECDDDDDGTIYSSQYERFGSLRSLHLETVSPASHIRFFEVDTALPNLQCLHVSPSFTTCYDHLAQLLPNLTHAAVIVLGPDYQLLQDFADLHCIRYLCLGFIERQNDSRQVSFVVQADCSLHELQMVVAGVIMDIKVQKSDLCHDCRGDRWAISKAATQGNACTVPTDFQPLSCRDLERIRSRGQ